METVNILMLSGKGRHKIKLAIGTKIWWENRKMNILKEVCPNLIMTILKDGIIFHSPYTLLYCAYLPV